MDAPGSTSLIDISINTGDAPPFQSVTYHFLVALLGPVKDSLDFLLCDGIIEQSTGPWSSPMLPVRKRDGMIRICIDFRLLNAVTIPDPYLIPQIDAIIDHLSTTFLSSLTWPEAFIKSWLNLMTSGQLPGESE